MRRPAPSETADYVIILRHTATCSGVIPLDHNGPRVAKVK